MRAGPLPFALTLLLAAPLAAADVPAGSYAYTALAAPGVAEARNVAFHPDGSYAIVLEVTNRVQVLDWASRAVSTFDLTPATGSISWSDLLFDPAGGFALLVGSHVDTTVEGVVYRLDDAQYRSGGSAAQVFAELPGLRLTGRYEAIESPWDGGPPVVLLRNETGSIARLREIDAANGTFGSLDTASASAAGCQDLAFADNELGGPGILVVCGLNGRDVLYYTEVGAVPEWRTNLADGALSNVSVAAARTGGDYALVVNWAGRRILRFESGLLGSTGSSPWFPTRGIFHVAFAPDGNRALVVGSAQGDPLVAAVLEYRHDLFTAAEITDVSIQGFDGPPYLGTASTWLWASAWRPGCDGGLIVGGETDFTGSTGRLIEFALVGGSSCDLAAPVPGLAWPALSALALVFLTLGWRLSTRRAG